MAKGATEIEREIRVGLSGCTVDARGLWHELRYLIEQSDRPGHLRRNGRPLNDGQLAIAAGCPSDTVARLLQDLVDAGLIERISGCWVSRQLAAMHERREKRRELTRSWRARGDEGRAVRRRESQAKSAAGVSRDTSCDQADNAVGVSRDTERDQSETSLTAASASDQRFGAENGVGVSRDTPCDQRVTEVCTGPPSPPSSLPLKPPLLHPPQPLPFPAETGRDQSVAGGGAARGEGGRREKPEIVDRPDELPEDLEDDGVPAARDSPAAAVRRGRTRKLSDEQLGIRDRLQAWWIGHCWPERHEGVEYPDFDGSDAAAVLKVLRSKEIGWDERRAMDLLRMYVRQPEIYGCIGHRLRELGHKLGFYLTLLKRQEKGLGNAGNSYPRRAAGPRTAADRGEYESDLPVAGRKLA